MISALAVEKGAFYFYTDNVSLKTKGRLVGYF
jgi:hypothetical protein